jgi:hypothetical protein
VRIWLAQDEERARSLARSRCRQCGGAGVVAVVDEIDPSGEYRGIRTGARCTSCDALVEMIRAAIEGERIRIDRSVRAVIDGHTTDWGLSCNGVMALTELMVDEEDRARIQTQHAPPEDALEWLRLGMSPRAANQLWRRGIRTYDALTNHTAAELRRYRGLGLRLVQDIELALAKTCRTLRPEVTR